MAEKINRYCLAQYCLNKVRSYDNEAEYENMIKSVKKNNSNKDSVYICGNIDKKYVDGKIVATVEVYKRLDLPDTLKRIDESTKEMSNSNDIKNKYKDKLHDNIHPVYITYFAPKQKGNNIQDKKDAPHYDIGIKTLPIFYKKDQIYLNEKYVKVCISEYAKHQNFKFFLGMCMWFIQKRELISIIERIRSDIDSIKYYGLSETGLVINATNLYYELTRVRDKSKRFVKNSDGTFETNYRALRDFGTLLKSENLRYEEELHVDPDKLR